MYTPILNYQNKQAVDTYNLTYTDTFSSIKEMSTKMSHDRLYNECEKECKRLEKQPSFLTQAFQSVWNAIKTVGLNLNVVFRSINIFGLRSTIPQVVNNANKLAEEKLNVQDAARLGQENAYKRAMIQLREGQKLHTEKEDFAKYQYKNEKEFEDKTKIHENHFNEKDVDLGIVESEKTKEEPARENERQNEKKERIPNTQNLPVLAAEAVCLHDTYKTGLEDCIYNAIGVRPEITNDKKSISISFPDLKNDDLSVKIDNKGNISNESEVSKALRDLTLYYTSNIYQSNGENELQGVSGTVMSKGDVKALVQSALKNNGHAERTSFGQKVSIDKEKAQDGLESYAVKVDGRTVMNLSSEEINDAEKISGKKDSIYSVVRDEMNGHKKTVTLAGLDKDGQTFEYSERFYDTGRYANLKERLTSARETVGKKYASVQDKAQAPFVLNTDEVQKSVQEDISDFVKGRDDGQKKDYQNATRKEYLIGGHTLDLSVDGLTQSTRVILDGNEIGSMSQGDISDEKINAIAQKTTRAISKTHAEVLGIEPSLVEITDNVKEAEKTKAPEKEALLADKTETPAMEEDSHDDR